MLALIQAEATELWKPILQPPPEQRFGQQNLCPEEMETDGNLEEQVGNHVFYLTFICPGHLLFPLLLHEGYNHITERGNEDNKCK